MPLAVLHILLPSHIESVYSEKEKAMGEAE